MKKFILVLAICMFGLVGCSGEKTTETDKKSPAEENIEEKDVETSEKSSKKYKIGDEVDLCGVKFNIYKIDDDSKELYLLAQKNIKITAFSDYKHDYEGSLVEGYINRFVDDFEDKGIVIKSSGIIDKDDLYDLGFIHSDGLSGLPYKYGDAPEFVNYEDMYWVGGYCKYETRSWAYSHGLLDTQSCNDEYGVRPVIVIDSSELDKPLRELAQDLTIKDIVDSDYKWTSEGGIKNPYDSFYFDCDNMLFINVFQSSKLNETHEFNMKFIDEKTIQVDGVRKMYEVPAEFTIVDADTLRIRFIDDEYNDGDYYLNKTNEER